MSGKNGHKPPAAPKGNKRALQHGAHSAELLAPRRARHLAELRSEFPHASERRLQVQAHRGAQLELLGEFLDERGVIRVRRSGTVFPAAVFAEKVAGAYLAELARLEEERRQYVNGDGESLESVLSELAEGGDGV